MSSVLQSGSGLNDCEQILAAQGGVCCICIDKLNGSIVAGVQNTIRYTPHRSTPGSDPTLQSPALPHNILLI